MAIMAVAFPIAPGKTEDWRRFVGRVEGRRHAEYIASAKGLAYASEPSCRPRRWATS